MDEHFLHFLETAPERDIPAVQQACAEIQALFHELSLGEKAELRSEVETRMRELRDLVWELRGPSSAASVNAVWHTGQRFLQGECELQTLRELAYAESQSLRARGYGEHEATRLLERLATPDTRSASLLEETLAQLPQAARGWNPGPGLTGDWLDRFLTSGEPGMLIELEGEELALLRELATDWLAGEDVETDLRSVWASLKASAEVAPPRLCGVCGQTVPPLERQCPVCRSVPREAAAEEAALQSEHFSNLYEAACAFVDAGAKDEFRRQLDAFHARLRLAQGTQAAAIVAKAVEAAEELWSNPDRELLAELLELFADCESVLLE